MFVCYSSQFILFSSSTEYWIFSSFLSVVFLRLNHRPAGNSLSYFLYSSYIENQGPHVKEFDSIEYTHFLIGLFNHICHLWVPGKVACKSDSKMFVLAYSVHYNIKIGRELFITCSLTIMSHLLPAVNLTFYLLAKVEICFMSRFS